MYNVYAGILKMSNLFFDDGKKCEIKYILNQSRPKLCEKYHIHQIAGNNSELQKVKNLIVWLSHNTIHKGDYDNHIHPDALSLLNYSFNNPKHGINCTALSTILSHCLSALGIRTRVITLIPYSPYDLDCHVVCEAYISELKKWIMLDPTYGTYVTDTNNLPLSVAEIRTQLADKKEIQLSNTAHYNNKAISVCEITEYYAKDMFIIELDEIQGTFSRYSRVISIVPSGFDMNKRRKINAAFAIDQLGSHQWIINTIDKRTNRDFIYKDISILK